MKRTIVLLLISFSFLFTLCAQASLDSLLAQLDKTIHEHSIYSQSRERQIEQLKLLIERTVPNSLEHYELSKDLYQAYKPYICDSAIHYLNLCVDIADRLNDTYHKQESMLQLAHLAGSTGMYKEGMDILSEIDRSKLPRPLLADYYYTLEHLYGELGFYTQDKKKSAYYTRLSYLYGDTLQGVLPPDDDRLIKLRESYCRNTHSFAEAHAINEMQLKEITPYTAEHALVCYHRSLTYQFEGNIEMEKYYLALSALSDIRAAIKDHASLWMLADRLFDEGDIDRAYEYIRFSWDETMFYNARLRSLQSAAILSLIDKTYQAKIEKQNATLQRYLMLISALSVILVAALLFIFRQMRKLAIARKNLQEANEQLHNLNDELKSVNAQLKTANLDLSESNQIKEEYIGRFIKLCSTYIDKLDAYRRMVNKKIAKGEVNELFKITKSHDALDGELEELYHNFDTAFLLFFPDFLRQVNSLLQPDDPILLKKGEVMNTELRILALMRLGINDSAQIAEFLRYSLNTIYNYRAKLKNRAIGSRDEFENKVREIR